VFNPKNAVQFISTGVLVADLVTGGGWPRARVSELFSFDGMGKSSMVFETMAKCVRNGGTGILIDAEQSFDPNYCYDIYGLEADNKKFSVFSPECAEDADVILDSIFANMTQLDILAFDSIAAMLPRDWINCSLEDNRKVGAHSQAIGAIINKTRINIVPMGTAAVFTNQIRATINTNKYIQNQGVGSGFNVMENYTTPGGFAPRFYSSLRLRLEYEGRVEDTNFLDPITNTYIKSRGGHTLKIINVKNKVARPFLRGVATFNYPDPLDETKPAGWNNTQDLIEILKKRGHISQRGTRFEYTGINESFVNVGAMVESERLFATNPKLVEDATTLLFQKVKEKGAGGILDKVKREEMISVDFDSKAEAYPTQEEEEVQVKIPPAIGVPDNSCQDAPIEEITL
ncbi:MAG: hypothetical protein HQK56_21205, partial [Deltaproteobacteria bacterium]|nr:hypothetical protein [Deltaproteobacteria bacterium]